MIASVLLAAALASAVPVVRPLADTPSPARFVRLRLDVSAYGVGGRGEIVIDRATGRFVRRFDAGPVSDAEGWDGVHPWRADATGMPRVEGNSDERAAIVAWSLLLTPVDGTARERALKPPELNVDANGELTSVVRHVGHAVERTSFSDYRNAGGFALPFVLSDTSENGTWHARVVAVETPRAVGDDAFAPPPEPRDFELDGVESVPLLGGGVVPIVAVRIDDGPPLRFAFDTGGQNVITPAAARRSGLTIVGEGTVGGAGPGLAKTRYAAARSVRVGRASLRNQAFDVLDLPGGAVDGIVGYELLARFAARVDMKHRRLQLAGDGASLVPSGTVVAMVYDDRQPQVDGAIDGIAGALTIDTGSASAVDVNAPFVIAHDLRTRYHAEVGGYPISGVGGAVHAYFAHAAELRIGDLLVPDVNLLLTDAQAGVEAEPTVAANVGMQVLRRFTLVLDYRRRTLTFETPVP
jgi:hypothetical protein